MIKIAKVVAVMFFGVSSASQAFDIGSAFEQDVTKFKNNFVCLHQKPSAERMKSLDAALVQLQWAGITDPRIFDPIKNCLIDNKKLPATIANKFVRALVFSGNVGYLDFLTGLTKDENQPSNIRNEAKKYLPLFDKYREIALTMNIGTENVKTNLELWGVRHANGLKVSDPVRMRLAARDLYLNGYSVESLNVAQEVLLENSSKEINDSYRIDTMSFLCKALGLSRRTEYKDALITVANNTPERKLRVYAERSVQYMDRSFKASNPHKKQSR